MTDQLIFTELAGFQPKQLEAWYALLDPQTKYLLYGGSMGPGKSYTLRWSALGFAMYIFSKYNIRDLPVGLFSKDYPTLRDRQIAKISMEFPDWLGKISESQLWGLSFNIAPRYGGGHIMLRNLDDPSKYKSTEFAGEFVEELTENDEEKFMLLKTRLRYPGLEEVKFMAATNPGDVGHGYCKRNFVQGEALDSERARYKYVHATVYDNKFATKTYIEQLEALPEKEKKMYLYGSWDVFAGQYFSEWNEAYHVINPFIPTPNSLIVGGMDWGRSSKPSHKTAFYCGFDVVEKVFYKDISWYRCKTFLEVTGKEKTPEEWAKEIKTNLQSFGLTLNDIAWIQADTAMFHPKEDGSESVADQFGGADDRYIALLRPSNKDRIGGWEVMHKWLRIAPDGMPYWQIARNAPNLIRTLPELIHDDNRQEDVDCFVKGTKVTTLWGEKNIEDVRVNDLVLTPIGYRKVIKAGISGHSEKVVEVALSNGKRLKGTANHPVFIHGKGMVALQSLSIYDILGTKNTTWLRKENRLFITALSIIATLGDSTTHRMERCLRWVISNYINRYTQITMEQSQRAITFTTRILITIITPQKILLPYPLMNTSFYTSSAIMPIQKRKQNITNGTTQIKDERNYRGTLRKCDKRPLHTNIRARIVEQLLQRNLSRKSFANSTPNTRALIKLLASFVAKLNGSAQQALIQRRPVHILAVGRLEEEQVYKLTVKDAHLYYANGVLVSNTEGEDHPADGERYKKMHLKWIDAGNAGAVISNQLITASKTNIIIKDGKQQGFDLAPFERVSVGGNTRVIGGD